MNDRQKDQITRMRANGAGYRTIAGKLGISANTVKSYCRRNGLGGVAKPKRKAVVYSGEVSYCQNCGAEIRQLAKRKRKRFCCDKCRNQWWNAHLDLVDRRALHTRVCPVCGKEFEVYGSAPRKYCSHACYIKDRFGGKNSDKEGV
jgi:endogenous inhibitor of DNA gyrase (YacG/DUF329 family)